MLKFPIYVNMKFTNATVNSHNMHRFVVHSVLVIKVISRLSQSILLELFRIEGYNVKLGNCNA